MNIEELVELVSKSSEVTKYEDAAPEVVALAQKLIDECDELAVAADARIKYLFVKGLWKSAGECSRSTGKWRHMTGYDFVITLHRDTWFRLSDHAKKALMHHELSHITKRKEKWALRKHDIEEFFSTAARFGSWSDELKTLKRILEDEKDD